MFQCPPTATVCLEARDLRFSSMSFSSITALLKSGPDCSYDEAPKDECNGVCCEPDMVAPDVHENSAQGSVSEGDKTVSSLDGLNLSDYERCTQLSIEPATDIAACVKQEANPVCTTAAKQTVEPDGSSNKPLTKTTMFQKEANVKTSCSRKSHRTSTATHPFPHTNQNEAEKSKHIKLTRPKTARPSMSFRKDSISYESETPRKCHTARRSPRRVSMPEFISVSTPPTKAVRPLVRRHTCNAGGPRARSTKVKTINKNTGTVSLLIKVDSIDFPHDPNKDWVLACQAKVLSFYDFILDDKVLFLHALAVSPYLQGCTVQDIEVAGLSILLEVHSIESLDCLTRAVDSGDLENQLSHLLVSEYMLEKVGILEMRLTVSVSERELKSCRLYLLSEHAVRSSFRRGSHSGGNQDLTTMGSCSGSEEAAASYEKCRLAMASLCDQTKCTLHQLTTHLSQYESSLGQLIFTLRLVKPRTLTSFRTLSDVIKCHTYLENSPSVGKSVQTNLVTNLLKFVSTVKESVSLQIENLIQLSPKLVKHVPVTQVLQFKHNGRAFLLKTEPGFEFSTNSVPDIHLNIMDEKLFRKLLGYLPELFVEYKKFMTELNNLYNTLDTHALEL